MRRLQIKSISCKRYRWQRVSLKNVTRELKSEFLSFLNARIFSSGLQHLSEVFGIDFQYIKYLWHEWNEELALEGEEFTDFLFGVICRRLYELSSSSSISENLQSAGFIRARAEMLEKYILVDDLGLQLRVWIKVYFKMPSFKFTENVGGVWKSCMFSWCNNRSMVLSN